MSVYQMMDEKLSTLEITIPANNLTAPKEQTVWLAPSSRKDGLACELKDDWYLQNLA